MEISEISLSEIEKELLRLEAEFYTATIKSTGYSFKGENIIKKVQYGTSKELNENGVGIPTLRLNEIKNTFILEKPAKFCCKLSDIEIKNLYLKKGDVLICRTNGNANYVGRAGIVMEDMEYIFASYLYRVVPTLEKINSETLVAFLNSKYGREQINKQSMQSNQVNFSPAKFRTIDIPKFSKNIQDSIAYMYSKAYTRIKNAKEKYSKAENMLLAELGLKDFHPSSENVSIKTLQESFLKTGRLDSEYYQVKYDDYLGKIYSYDNGYDLLGNCCTIKDKKFMPKKKEQYCYIELANVNNFAEITDCNVFLGKELPTRARRKVNTGDVIVSSIEGSLESCALITKEYNNSLCSTGFYVINSKKINSETLLILFKSFLMFNLMKKGCSGTILTSISNNEFVDLPIPIIKKEVQDEIAGYIQESQEYSKKAKELLHISVKAVEMAIECGEEKALLYLSS